MIKKAAQDRKGCCAFTLKIFDYNLNFVPSEQIPLATALSYTERTPQEEEEKNYFFKKNNFVADTQAIKLNGPTKSLRV